MRTRSDKEGCTVNLNDLEDAERFQKLFVAPLVDAVRAEVKPLVEADRDHEDRLKKLESNQKRALVGLSAVVLAVTIAFNAVVDYLRNKFIK